MSKAALALDEAEALAERAVTAIEERQETTPSPQVWHSAEADLERIASDLRGLRFVTYYPSNDGVREQLLPLFLDGLRRTAGLYGVEPHARGEERSDG